MPLFQNRFKPKGKLAYITGGSTGLGRALAIYLLKAGTDVVIVAQNPERLAKTESELLALAAPGQKVFAVSADLTKVEESYRAFEEAIKLNEGRVPDYAFLCAGLSKPKYWIDLTVEEMKTSIDLTYWIQAWSAHAVTKTMIANRVKGTVVFVSSFLGYTTFAGYTPYSPGKYALRGLADALRSEMLLHDIDVHCFMPAGIDSPGFIAEQEHKPPPTKKLEETDVPLPPDAVVGHLVRGLQRGYYQPTSWWITDLMRLQSSGGVPGNNPFVDFVWWIAAAIGMPIWVFCMDRIVKSFRKEVQADLEAKGYYKVSKVSSKTV